MPFHGTSAEAREVLRMLGSLELRPDDEAILVDNTPGRVAQAAHDARRVRIIGSPVVESAYAARNVGAEAAANPWLLFCDADCTPPHDLLDRYFAEAPDHRCGALAGGVTGDPAQPGLIPRYVRSRRHLDQAAALAHPYKPMAVTANLLVRRDAWNEVGGFQEGTRSGADAEFCWRIQEAGWALVHRPDAAVTHRHRDNLAALLRQAARDGAGGAWIENRRSGSGARPRVARELARAAAGIALWTLAGRLERAAFKAIDAIWVLAWNAGYLMSNDAPDPRREAASAIAVLETYPSAAQRTFAERLARDGARVEAVARSERPDWAGGRVVPANFSEDEGPGRIALDTLWLLTRHPARCFSNRARSSTGEPLRKIAPVIRRAARSGRTRVLAAPSSEARAGRVARLAGLPLALEHERAVADAAAHDGDHLDEVVQDQIGGE